MTDDNVCVARRQWSCTRVKWCCVAVKPTATWSPVPPRPHCCPVIIDLSLSTSSYRANPRSSAPSSACRSLPRY